VFDCCILAVTAVTETRRAACDLGGLTSSGPAVAGYYYVCATVTQQLPLELTYFIQHKW